MKSKMNGGAGQDGLSRQHEPEVKAGVRTSSQVRFRKILVAIDFSECSFHALAVALDLAIQFGSRLVLLHVVEPTVYPDTPLSLGSALDETAQNLVQSGRERLEALTRRKIGIVVGTEMLVRIGHAHSEIADTAKALGVELIVISTQGYGASKSVSLGSTAEKVLRHAACAVLAVKPIGTC